MLQTKKIGTCLETLSFQVLYRKLNPVQILQYPICDKFHINARKFVENCSKSTQ